MSRDSSNAGNALTPSQLEWIASNDESFIDANASINKAFYKLKILRIEDAVEALSAFHDNLRELRQPLVFDKILTTAEQKETIKKGFGEQKDLFYSAINSYFSSFGK